MRNFIVFCAAVLAGIAASGIYTDWRDTSAWSWLIVWLVVIVVALLTKPRWRRA